MLRLGSGAICPSVSMPKSIAPFFFVMAVVNPQLLEFSSSFFVDAVNLCIDETLIWFITANIRKTARCTHPSSSVMRGVFFNTKAGRVVRFVNIDCGVNCDTL